MTPLLILETPRLLVRRFSLDDLPAAHAIYADPEVMCLATGADLTLDATRARLERRLAQYREHGIGPWALIEKESGALLGDCGLARLEGTDSVELGYRLRRSSWGRGYALEAARAVLAHGFDKLGLAEIVAVVLDQNERSIRVLQRLGFARRGPAHHHGHDVLLYALNQR